MDRWRIEVGGARGDLARFRLLGRQIEIIVYEPRAFVPTDAGSVLSAILARHPIQALAAAV